MTSSASEHPRLGPYVVIERLARGGMGTTYLVRRDGETLLRVLKLGHTGGPKEALIHARLAREAAVGARLQHPHVAALVDTGVTDQGRLYLVFEYVTGPSLTSVLESWRARGARPPVDVAVGLGLQLLDALHHIHEARDEDGALLYAVHRDVGPNNVMLELSGIAKLIDLGLVRDARSDWRTESRVVVGTAQYVAPEIASGGAKYADRRADLYSMGILLYELLLAEPMFAAGTGIASILGQLIEPNYPHVMARRSDVPPALDAVVMRALAAKPEDRWPNAVAFAEALRQAGAVAGRGRIAAFLAPELDAHRAATAHRRDADASGEEAGSATSPGTTPQGTQVVRRRPGAAAEPQVRVSPEGAFNNSELLREVLPTRVLARGLAGGAPEVGWPKRWVVAVGLVWTVVWGAVVWAVTWSVAVPPVGEEYVAPYVVEPAASAPPTIKAEAPRAPSSSPPAPAVPPSPSASPPQSVSPRPSRASGRTPLPAIEVRPDVAARQMRPSDLRVRLGKADDPAIFEDLAADIERAAAGLPAAKRAAVAAQLDRARLGAEPDALRAALTIIELSPP